VSDEVIRRTWPGCDDNTEVVLYLVEGGGHSWPGTPIAGEGADEAAAADPAIGGLASVAGVTTQDISATELAWAFFQRHRLNAPCWEK
jgi:polyhydroxybutyrate depolymerase